MKITIRFFLIGCVLVIPLYFFSSSIVFSQTTTSTTQATKPPFYSLFTDAEKKYYDTVLTEEQRQKLIRIYQTQLSSKKPATNVSTTSQTQVTNPYLPTSVVPQTLVPTRPMTPSPTYNSTYPTNPYLNGSQMTHQPSRSDAMGINQNTNYVPLTPEEMKNLPKLGDPNADCSNFGTTGVSMANVDNRIKMDTNRFCIAFGRKIDLASTYRAGQCHSGNQHSCGRAIDPNVKKFGDRKTQTLLTLAFMCSGYNVGSYEPGYPAHFDIEPSGRWKTWSRWAHTNGMTSLPYEPYIQDAMNLIGLPSRSADDYVRRYGRHTKAVMAAKAKAYMDSINLGALCRPEGKV